MKKATKELIDKEARAAEEAELTTDQNAPLPKVVKITRGHDRSKVLQVRLNDDEFALVEKLAREQMLPVSTLARSILIRAIRS